MKKFISIILVLIISIFCILPVGAEDATEATGTETIKTNLWTYKNWDTYFSDVDLTKYDFDYLRDVSFDYTLLEFNKNDISNSLGNLIGLFINADTLTYADGILYSDNCTKFCSSVFSSCSIEDRSIPYNSKLGKSAFNIGMHYSSDINLLNNNYIWIISDYDVYKSFATAYPDFAEQIYYCPDPLQSFIDYLDWLKYDDMFYDVYPLQDCCNHIIRFYDCFDSYYGKYQYDFYTDNMLNYLNSSYSLSGDLYYTSSATTTGKQDQQLQHNESINLYIPLSSDYVSNLSSDNTDNIVNSYLNSIGSAVHYEKGPIDFSTWYDTYIKPWLSKNNFNTEYKIVTLKNVEPSTEDNVTVNKSDKKQDIYLIRLTFPNSYSFIESETESSFMMSGCRTMSTARLIDLHSGSLPDTSGNGYGSNIDGGDYLDNRDRDDLLADGWKNGYPNRSSYPYKVTLNKNGNAIYEIYFDKKPSVSSDFYSDSQIAYFIDFNYTRGYVYAVEHNCYVDFNFRNNVEDDYLNSDGTIIDDVTDAVNKGIVDTYYKLINLFVNGVGYSVVEDYDYVDYEKLLQQYIIKFWTNYTGQLNGVYRGYYVQFNWNLENDPNFFKNNSDDTHNYTDDFLDDSGGFTDNNGNTHGGAVETPTETPNYSGFNNDDFSFDENSLWDYANSFLNFCARAFVVLPSWMWQLIASSLVVIIILRILGR